MAIADSGYIAPDNLQPSSGNSKADVYAFGVLLLEILTGRKPFDKYYALPLFTSTFPFFCYCIRGSIFFCVHAVHDHQESSHW